MTNLGAHEIDIVQWFLAAKGPATVASTGGRWSLKDGGETPDTPDAVFGYDAKLSLQVSIREAAVGRGQGNGTEFFGTKGSLTISRGGFQVFPDLRQPPENLIPQMGGGHPTGGPKTTPAKPEPWIAAMKEPATNDLLVAHARNFVDCMKREIARRRGIWRAPTASPGTKRLSLPDVRISPSIVTSCTRTCNFAHTGQRIIL